MSQANPYFRIYSFLQDQILGLDFSPAKLEAELNAIQTTLEQIRARQNLIQAADGSLQNVPSVSSLSLSSTTRFVATASQTAFTVATYNISTDTVIVFVNNALLDTNSVTKTNTTTVTLPAQTAGAVVIILVFSTGAGVLTQLALTTTPGGASYIGIYDVASLYAATNVETALAEVMTAVNLINTNFGAASQYIKKNGTVTFTASQPMGGFKLTGLTAGTTAGDSVEYTQFNTLPMGGNKVTGLAAGTVAGDAVRYEQWTNTDGGSITSGLVLPAHMTPMVGASAGVDGVAGIVPKPVAGDNVKILYGDGTYKPLSSTVGSGYILLQDQKVSGTNAAASFASAWTKRELNTEVEDTGSHCTLNGSSQFTLTDGTYRLRATGAAYNAGSHQMRLYSVSGSAVVANGIGRSVNSTNAGADESTATLVVRFTIPATTTVQFELQHWVNFASIFGQPVTTGGIEIYAEVEIIRE